MKKYLLKKYDDSAIRFYKTFDTEEELLKFANKVIGITDTPIHGPFYDSDKIVYRVDIEWFYHKRQ